jgi:hypothetical protein
MNAKQAAEILKSYGREGDTELVHMTKGEVAGLQQLAEAAGGSLTINPVTGQPEAFFLAALLPTIIGGVGSAMGLGALGTAALGAGVGALTNRKDPIMGALTGAMGGYGGGQLTNALGAAGAAGSAMGSAVPGQAAAELAKTEAAKQAVAAGATGQGSQAAMLAAQNVGVPTAQLATNTLAPSSFSAAGQGIAALGTEAGRSAALQSLGGVGGAMRTAGMATAPMMYGSMFPGQAAASGKKEKRELPEYDYDPGMTGDYYGAGGNFSTGERQFFKPTFTRRFANGGIASLAQGGNVNMQSGDFVIPADVVAYAGGGSTEAGMAALSKKLGAVPIKGAGNGLSDDIPATIDGKQPARVANGEMLVKQPGKKGSQKLYGMMKNIRKQATGTTKQVRPVNLDKALA